MATSAPTWDGGFLGAGPHLLSPVSDQDSPGGDVGLGLLVGPISEEKLWIVGPAQFGTFLERHPAEMFLSLDAVALHRRLLQCLSEQRDPAALRALWSL